MNATPKPFDPEALADPWPAPDPAMLAPPIPPAPVLPLGEVVGPRLARWITDAAEGKSAPPDYVLFALLAVAGALAANAREASPWGNWKEPPILWSMLIGNPSAGKSPAADAVMKPLRKAEAPLREAAEADLRDHAEAEAVAKLAHAAWQDKAAKALKDGFAPPPMPDGAGPAPILPRLVVNDCTVERLAVLLAGQSRGILQFRDELAGWLTGMARYTGASDRPFWLEANGARAYVVERMQRSPVSVPRLSVGILGGIQPDRLKTLLFKPDDDGLLARFMPIWPEPAPVRRPRSVADDDVIAEVLACLVALAPGTDEDGHPEPVVLPFTEPANRLMDQLRDEVRDMEAHCVGLMLSFVGKLPGLATRLALVLALLDHAAEGAPEPRQITEVHFGRAAHLVTDYLLPMARRTYADASVSAADRSARALLAVIRAQGWRSFTSRQVMRGKAAGLSNAADLDPALALLAEADCIREVAQPPGPKGGRKARVFEVNPAVLQQGRGRA